MKNITPAEAWGLLLGVASAIVLLSNAFEKIAKAVRAAKAPNAQQDERLGELESRMDKVEQKLANDKVQLEEINDGLRASYQAQLALLDHGIDGNNIKQMQDAKEVLQQHLINR